MKSILLVLTVAFAIHAQAADKKVSTLKVTDARIFAPLKGTNATAGYGKFTNDSDKPVKFTIEKVEPFSAVELHETVEKDGRMAMQKVEELTVAPHQSVDLKPGGHHIMLFDPTREVKADEKLKVFLKVNGQSQDFTFKVTPRVKPAGHHHH